jgi:DHA1 family multidrug/chloramphenicol efflux transport protein-like MFS transporter
MPLLGWIALSPVMLIDGAGWSPFGYGLAQVPVFGALIAGNLLLVRVTDKWPLGRPVGYGVLASALGGGIMVTMCGLSTQTAMVGIIVGSSLICLGQGLSFAVLYRFALTSSEVGKGVVAAGIGIVSMAGYAVGIELFRRSYFSMGATGFAWLTLGVMLLFWPLARYVTTDALRMRQASLNPVKDGC